MIQVAPMWSLVALQRHGALGEPIAKPALVDIFECANRHQNKNIYFRLNTFHKQD